jgi:hypothetical protein
VISQSVSSQQAAPKSVFRGVVEERGGVTLVGFGFGVSTCTGEGDGLGSGAGTTSVRFGGGDPLSSEDAISFGTSRTAAIASAAPAKT